MIIQSEVFIKNLKWFNTELENVLTMIKAKEYDKELEIESFFALKDNRPAHPFDLISSANMLTESIKNLKYSCCLSSIEERLRDEPSYDWFAYRMHILGHSYLEKDKFDLESMVDVGFIEISCFMFSVLAT